jgi:hypothetical protein
LSFGEAPRGYGLALCILTVNSFSSFDAWPVCASNVQAAILIGPLAGGKSWLVISARQPV